VAAPEAGAVVNVLSINVYVSDDMAEFLVYDVHVDTPIWQLQQRVHWQDLPAVIAEAATAVVDGAELDLDLDT
jgi:hypothetical protein